MNVLRRRCGGVELGTVYQKWVFIRKRNWVLVAEMGKNQQFELCFGPFTKMTSNDFDAKDFRRHFSCRMDTSGADNITSFHKRGPSTLATAILLYGT